MILTNYFIKRKVRSLVNKGSKRDHCFRGMKEARTVLVMYDAKDQNIIEPCLETIRMMHKQVKTFVYGTAETEIDSDSSVSLCAKTDLDFWGFPKESVCNKLKAINADILIDLSKPFNYVSQYLMLLHPCDFKVGIKRNEQDLYDLSISVTSRDDIKHLFGHILFYLQTIRSK
ncbi:DUF6913 domain-containing protein [Parabacteroides chinchillae]|uniref:Uncharacterized protein n=1 Tax=Parabacteroides chinchillae TaxID=871327 RepID=A0A8G2F620_9BACT|nr:hypothetical protein [Parabacteroides chinchillae]SEG20899.1 hypothetical protein SAMN05444001_12043 [Parabacteroides chinchillae]